MISTNRKSPNKKKNYVAAVYMRARVSEELANHLITSFPFFKKNYQTWLATRLFAKKKKPAWDIVLLA